MGDRFDVKSDQPLPLSHNGFGARTVIYNGGLSPVYLSNNTAIALDPASRGVAVPPLSYKEWHAGIPCFAMCASGQTSFVVVSENQGGLLVAPIGNNSVDIASVTSGFQTGTQFLPSTGAYDLSRYEAFSLILNESVDFTSGTQGALVRLYWLNTAAGKTGSTFLVSQNVVDVEDHYLFVQGGSAVLTGPVKAPYLVVVLDDLASGVVPTGFFLKGMLKADGIQRTDHYMIDFIGAGSTLVPTAGSVALDGSNGTFRYLSTGAMASGVTDNFYIANTWAGECTLTFRAVNAISTTPIEISVASIGQNGVGAGVLVQYFWMFAPVTTATRSDVTGRFFLPRGNVRFQVIQNSAAAVSFSIGGSMTRYD